MEWITIFFWTFMIVAIGELGDKTQIAAGTGTIANKGNVKIIFLSSSLALVTVAGITVLFAGLIPDEYIPIIIKVGGGALIAYGIYLYRQAGKNEADGEKELLTKNKWGVFFSHFSIVFVAELGDKTQIATLAIAIDNQSYLFIVFLSSALALVSVTAVTVWGVTKIPTQWISGVQKLGAFLMIAYGIHMVI